MRRPPLTALLTGLLAAASTIACAAPVGGAATLPTATGTPPAPTASVTADLTSSPAAVAASSPTAVAAGLGRLAFVRGGDVWARDLPAGVEHQLTHGGGYAAPRWSPSGDWLAVRHRDDGGEELSVLGADGRIGSTAPLAGPVAWSPVEDRLAHAGATGTVVADPDGSDRVELRGATCPAWSPDGRWLACTATANRAEAPAASQLWRMRPDGSEARVLLDPGPDESPVGFLVAGWSPDGRRVLVWAAPAGSASLAADGVPLEAVPVDGGAPVVLAEAVLPHPDLLGWSPDGRLAATVGAGRQTWAAKAIALLAPPAPPAVRSAADRAALFPAWSPDGGRWLAYAEGPTAPSAAGGEPAAAALAGRRIWLVGPDGASRRPLLPESGDRDERPRWSADGRWLLWTRVPAGRAPELWLAPIDGAAPARAVATGLDGSIGAGPPDPGALGAYGYVDWGGLYDWWLGGRPRG